MLVNKRYAWIKCMFDVIYNWKFVRRKLFRDDTNFVAAKLIGKI